MAGDTREDPVVISTFEQLMHPTTYIANKRFYRYDGPKEINMNDYPKTSSTNNQNALIFYQAPSTDLGGAVNIDFNGLVIKNLTLNGNDSGVYKYFFYVNDQTQRTVWLYNLTLKDAYLQGADTCLFKTASKSYVCMQRVAISALVEGGSILSGGYYGSYMSAVNECSFNIEIIDLSDVEFPIIEGDLRNSRVMVTVNLMRLTEGVSSNETPYLVSHIWFNNIVDVSFVHPGESAAPVSKSFNIDISNPAGLSGGKTYTSNLYILRFEGLNDLTIADGNTLTIRVPNVDGSLIACEGTDSENSKIKLIANGGGYIPLVYIPYADLQNPKKLRGLGFPIGVDS